MMKEYDDPIAAFERALGLDDTATETEAERAERERLEYRLAPLAGLLEPVEPSNDLFARILMQTGVNLPLAGTHVARTTDGEWETLSPGIETKTLWRSLKSGRHTFLLRIHPGAILHEHDHAGDEECMVMEGDMVVNGVTFGPGDFQVFFGGTHHPLVTSHRGCICLLSVQQRAA